MPPAFLVDTQPALDRFVADWLPRLHDAVVALDIEEERGQSYHPRVALIQLSVDGDDAIVDPIALGHKNLEATVEQILLTPKVIILHGGRNDVAGLRRDFDVGPGQLADTQIAARFLGERQFGLSALLKEHFDIHLDKEERRSDWSQRPLTESQLRYAQADTHHLEQLWHTLDAQSRERGWADAVEEECAALGDIPADHVNFDPHGWLKIKGMRARDEDIRRRASRLWWWRDQVGEAHNTHPSQVMPTWALEQAAIRGLGWLKGQHSVIHRLAPFEVDPVASIQDAFEADIDLPLDRPRERRGQPSPLPPDTLRNRHDALSHWRDETAEATGIEAGWLAPRTILEEVARATPDDIDTLGEQGDVRRWRLERFADDWREILKKHR